MPKTIKPRALTAAEYRILYDLGTTAKLAVSDAKTWTHLLNYAACTLPENPKGRDFDAVIASFRVRDRQAGTPEPQEGNTYAKMLIYRLQERGFTQRDIATACGVHYVSVNRWAQGGRSASPQHVARLEAMLRES